MDIKEKMKQKIIAEAKQKIIAEMKRLSAQKTVSITINPNKKVGLTDSKFGGLPYWDMSQEYPKSKEGTLLVLLAQINLDQLNQEGKNPENRLPQTGMLQFFIECSENYLMGMESDGKDENGNWQQTHFRVVYHQTIDPTVSVEQVEALGVPVMSQEGIADYAPLWEEWGLDFTVQECYINSCTFNFQEVLRQAIQNIALQMEIDPTTLDEDEIEAAVYDAEETFESGGHHMLGYPYFTQTDPREYDETLLEYNTLLFQMDSDDNGKKGQEMVDYVLWGDCGVANFFINDKDLEKANFQNVYYTWDCC